jgi:hypothetical protein
MKVVVQKGQVYLLGILCVYEKIEKMKLKFVRLQKQDSVVSNINEDSYKTFYEIYFKPK